MSTASDSVMEITRYPESSPINAALHRTDERSNGRPERADSSFLDTIVGRRGSLRPILNQVEAVAGTNTPGFITGETGAGNEGLARAIHDPSPRPRRHLVKRNRAALPTAPLAIAPLLPH